MLIRFRPFLSSLRQSYSLIKWIWFLHLVCLIVVEALNLLQGLLITGASFACKLIGHLLPDLLLLLKAAKRLLDWNVSELG